MSFLSKIVDKVKSNPNYKPPAEETNPLDGLLMPVLPSFPSFNIDWGQFQQPETVIPPPAAPNATEAAQGVRSIAAKEKAARSNPVTRQSTILTSPSGASGSVRRRKLLGGGESENTLLGG